MIIDIGYWNKVIKRIIIFLLTIFLIYIIMKLFVFFMPFLIAIVISSMMEPFIQLIMRKTKITRKRSAIISLIIVFSIILAVIGWGIVITVTESSKLLSNLNQYIQALSENIDSFINSFDIKNLEIPDELKNIIINSSNEVIGTGTGYVKSVLNYLLNLITKIPTFFIYFVITILATYFICTDRLFILDSIEHHFPKKWVRKTGFYFKEISKSLGSYLKAEVILVIIAFIITLIGLYIFKLIGLNISYPLLIALGIGFVDALPILGSGTVMVPWAVVSFINGDIKLSIAISILFIIITVTRQLIEPRIVSRANWNTSTFYSNCDVCWF
ncbi:MAG: sporulation integral membrane protein YtvI [Clostridia bacterium]|nr:sporulation integral membrane protein YtvI [Clostridia bacterium]